ncbi:tumor necrosis factor ligand superfamily member 10-like [Chanos chanos]|uniref:Tumor necrosis factor ligand superfamily member 10-like n=1 Tax=Chanos chanos TaxID=29144 RepID=A0A6J2W0P9_CHACN|nr:tumor necrosis factor ligand superfamily member 10-like [Chanos chanos]
MNVTEPVPAMIQRKITPAAHLPIKPQSEQKQRNINAAIVHWNAKQGYLSHLGYHNGRILIHEPGLYYIYAKTCFRFYYNLDSNSESVSGTDSSLDSLLEVQTLQGGVQLFQYVYNERLIHSSPVRVVLLMRSGSTQRWNQDTYHMCCQQQGGVFALRSGDGLYVNVSNSWMLDPDAEGSYFGTFRISE